MSLNGQSSDLNAKILERFEYYFGNENLQRDKFLQDEMKKDHGWIPLDVFFTFNRLNGLKTDKSGIAAALKDSDIVDISKDNEKVRRNPEVKKRSTVYIKGFPLEATLDDVMEYLKAHGEIVNVIMRRFKRSGLFKGSVFATFKDNKVAENFVENEDTQGFKNIELIRIMQNYSWGEQRRAAKNAFKNLKWKEAGRKTHSPVRFLKGQIMHVSGLPTENSSIASLKKFFNDYGIVAYVASIRFQSTEKDAAVKALEKMNESCYEIPFQGQIIQCKVLESEAEENYWVNFQNDKISKENFLAEFTKHIPAKDVRAHKSRGSRNNRSNKRTKADENADDDDWVIVDVGKISTM
uniref:Uncharacterized protein n=1 Tax=Panagrolaimus davidi TaxID=227884 RepID=A0A914PW96_9BILA